MQLSKHFTLAEATFSRTAETHGLDNMPSSGQLTVMKHTAARMEIVRELLGDNPIKVNSWFRGPELNKLVGGVATSQHSKGEAVDFTAPWFGSARDVALEIMKHKNIIQYDQLIYEQTWVHISFVTGNPRGSELTFHGKGKYTKGIV